jgi:hypothetical protein
LQPLDDLRVGIAETMPKLVTVARDDRRPGLCGAALKKAPLGVRSLSMARASELSEKQLNLLSAALRHARDAMHLLDVGHSGHSSEQAFHLAGFAPECARKALLGDRVFDKVLGHRLDAGAEVVLEAALALAPHARRYGARSWAVRYPALSSWSVHSRYNRSDTTAAATVTPVVEQAAKAVQETVAALFADGRIPVSFSW